MRQVFIIMGLALFIATSAIAAGFTDNTDGTITDTTTSLMWRKQDNGTTYTWEQAISYCEGLTISGYSDWRLPNIKELKSIVDVTTVNPAINSIFSNTQTSGYWSSTTRADNIAFAWGVDFSDGSANPTYSKTLDNKYVRCVRGGL
jgi:hypothetical protein